MDAMLAIWKHHVTLGCIYDYSTIKGAQTSAQEQNGGSS